MSDSAREPRVSTPPDSRHSGARASLILLLIVALGAFLRLFHLDEFSVWYDEAFSLFHSVRPLRKLVVELIRDVVHPPLHYLVLHGWFKLAGFGAYQARFISVVCGTLSIPLLYRLSRQFLDVPASLCAALLLAVSQVGVYFSQEARPYAQAQMLALLAAVLFLPFLQQPSWRRALAFLAASSALMFTHYYGAGVLLGLGLYWIVFRRSYSPLVFGRLAIVVIALVVLYLPWIALLRSRPDLAQVAALTTSRTTPSLDAPVSAISRYNNAELDSIDGPSPILPALIGLVLFSGLIAGAAWAGRGASRQAVWFGCLFALIPFAMAFAMGFLHLQFGHRHFSFAVPGYYLAVAAGWQVCLRTPLQRCAWLVASMPLATGALWTSYTVSTKPDYRGGFLPVAERFQPGDCMASVTPTWRDRPHFGFEVYYRDVGEPRLVRYRDLPSAPATCDRLWVISDHTNWMNRGEFAHSDQQPILDQLSAAYPKRTDFESSAISAALFERGDRR